MAQFLYERHSTNVHLNAAKRHIRLARQINGAEEFANTIEPTYNELLTKVAASKLATEECEIKRDLLILKDSLLDDKVRDVMDASKKFDRDNPGMATTSMLFSSGLGSVIYAPTQSEPTLVDQIILGIQSLGDGHALAIFISPLQTAIDECKTSIADLHTAIAVEKTAEALKAIAKLNLTRQYEQNIHSAGLKFGKQFINRLFPVIKALKKADDPEIVPVSVN
ncbi:MAG TPA: hypothetical protein VFC65_06435 [Prolixibacteraceae bacterium]|nr:hypothetical protein [Prolixibacteraceae bacterium]